MNHWTDKLVVMRACQPAIDYCLNHESLESAWTACERGDWMFWLAARTGVDQRLIVKAACGCARLALPHVKQGEERPRIAIETAEAWAEGKATPSQVRAAAARAADAADAARAAAYVAYAADAADAARAAAHAAAAAAADYAAHAAHAANAAAAAAYAAYAADAYAAAAAAHILTHKQCADIVRTFIPCPTL